MSGNTDVLIISPKGLEKENGFSASFESGYMTGKMNYFQLLQGLAVQPGM